MPKMQKEAAKAMEEYSKMDRDRGDVDTSNPGQPDNSLASKSY
jgi:hypothetical protein